MSDNGNLEQSRPSRKARTAREWEEARPKIKDLYIIQNLSLSETMAEMEKGGFLAREKLYKEKLKGWEIGKNATREDWLAWAKLYLEKRAVTNSSEIYIQIHNKIRRIQELRRYIKNHGVREEAFFDEAMRSEAPVPRYIRLCNQDGSSAADAEPSKPQWQAEVSPPRRQISLHRRTTRARNDTSDLSLQEATSCTCTGDDSDVVDRLQAMEFESALLESLQAQAHSRQNPQQNASQFAMDTVENSEPFDATGTDFLFARPEVPDDAVHFGHLSSLSSFQCVAVGDADALHQNIGNAPPSYFAHDTPPTNVTTDTFEQVQSSTPASNDADAQHAYAAACMIAAMLGAAGRKDKMARCLERAAGFFRQMCRFQSPGILTAASVVLTWLLVHAEGTLSERVIAASFVAATESLGRDNPVCLLLEWMTAAAARSKLRECRVASSQLWDIWHGFRQTLGEAHGHTIVALYCLSMQLILADKAFAEAEQYLQGLTPVAANVFGLSHALTINALATLSRAQLRQGKCLLALDTIDKSLTAAPLGLNHPHRLELLLRKALILRKLDQWDETEQLYWIVFKGRVATLGWQHNETSAAHDSLVWVMKERTGNWEAKKDEVHQCLVDPQVSVSDYESWWRRFVEANRATHIEDQDASGEEEYE
ncbi:hypothetical protein CLCR_09787 [Cladophialophora carrionii]|uniref:Clr5 domain-containing protein n=1 Tax=Cladophialophora carrionii TaxID=86049 RepID=A0A1C1CX67_9EURO|nr:hypothetical protein CLCR_09787 [Cladophialophora carrionii]